MSEARKLIEAEGPKAVFGKLPRTPKYYRFSIGNAPVTFCFSIIAVDDAQAVQRANIWLSKIAENHEPWEDQVRFPVFHLDIEHPVTATDISDIDDLANIFNEDAVARIVANFEDDFKKRGGWPG